MEPENRYRWDQDLSTNNKEAIMESSTQMLMMFVLYVFCFLTAYWISIHCN